MVLGELDDQPIGRELVARQDGEDRAAAELGGLERRRRQVDGQELVGSGSPRAPATIVSTQARSSFVT